ncbi:MAG: hypothetical protein ACRDD3_00675 [Azovibrio sp.]
MRGDRQPLEKCLAQCLGITADGLAPYRLMGERFTGETLTGTWFCADPVSLRFHHDRIILGDSSQLDIQPEEVQAILATLNQEFAHLGRFHAPSPQRWYLEAVEGLELPALPPLSAAAGRQLNSLMPDANTLSRLMNELQMVLHNHPVNQEREEQRRPTLNGLWLWGGGKVASPTVLPSVSSDNRPSIDGLWSDDPLASGLAQHLNLPIFPSPENISECLSDAHGKNISHGLISCENLLEPSLLEDQEGWVERLQQLEQCWFTPLRHALGHKVKTIDLISPAAYGLLNWHITHTDRWKFWKRPPQLQQLAHLLASSPLESSP